MLQGGSWAEVKRISLDALRLVDEEFLILKVVFACKSLTSLFINAISFVV